MAMSENRPTKKQHELLQFIDAFIKGNGYAPSYREIMRGLGYKSVSTVASHIENLTKKGLMNRGGVYKARTVEVVEQDLPQTKTAAIRQIENKIEKLEESEKDEQNSIEILKKALDILRAE